MFLFTTLQEGLPRSMMEAMAMGLPCVASSIRGNVDLIVDGKGGFLCSCTDVEGFSKSINTIAENYNMREQMKKYNLERIKSFDISVVEKEIKDIYREVLGD
jgi:glycosyltransferase involved in cell wall biosynthesis